MFAYRVLLCVVLVFKLNYCAISDDESNPNSLSFNISGLTLETFQLWQNATIPFYIEHDQFDTEQRVAILQALSQIAFKTCLKFAPVMRLDSQVHTMLFRNPLGIRRCHLNSIGHPAKGHHPVNIGYDCLRSPDIDMIIMKALGFTFEHNRALRDVYIDVQYENILPEALYLFTKDHHLPVELRQLPYDVDSVMHFDERAFSKNGHRTIIFKDPKTVQKRQSLTNSDMRRIEIVYGPECLKRDRQEKINICKEYPGNVRRKRAASYERRSLRVNPDITPPADIDEVKQDEAARNETVTKKLIEYGIVNEVEDVIATIYKVSSKALENAKARICNTTERSLRSDPEPSPNTKKPDLFGIIESVIHYTEDTIHNVAENLTEFCNPKQPVEEFLRAYCVPYSKNSRCTKSYRSTNIGDAMYSTQHRPWIRQSTKHSLRSESEMTENTPQEKIEPKDTTHQVGLTVSKNVDEDLTHTPKDALRMRTVIGNNGHKRKKRYALEPIRTATETSMLTTNVVAESSLDLIQSVSPVVKEKETTTANTISNLQNEALRQNENIRRMLDNHRFRVKTPKQGRPRIKPQTERYEDDDEERREPEKKYKYNSNEDDRAAPVQTVVLSKLNKEFYDDRKWPNRTVPYIISDDNKYDIDDVRQRIQEVNRILKEKTCVRLQEIEESDTGGYEDYIVLNTSPDYVTGKVGGRQSFGSIELFAGGQHRQHAAMMVMGMLGFYFEISRHDRDEYVRVHIRHIRPDKLHHFDKIRSDATLPLPYDFESATHPAWQFWRKIGKTGIASVATYKDLDSNARVMQQMGQNEKLLSDIDIVKINTVYECGKS